MVERTDWQAADWRPLRVSRIWRLIHTLAPIGFKINPLIRKSLYPAAIVRVPWSKHTLDIPQAWLSMRSAVAAPLYTSRRRLNPEFFAIVEPLLKAFDDGVIVDVGANIGIYTLNMRACTALDIVAYEPDPLTFQLLTRNIRENHLSAIDLRNVACGDRKEKLRFVSSANGNVLPRADGATVESTQNVISVPVVRLDDDIVTSRRVRLIKIDCEGYEYAVLTGCRKTLERHRSHVFVELHPKLLLQFGHTVEEVCDLLRPDYKMEYWRIWPRATRKYRIQGFLDRYLERVVKYRDESQMLRELNEDSMPDQLFLLASPKL